MSSAPSHLVGFCGTLVDGLGIRSAGQGSVSSVPGGTPALVAAGCFHGSQELEYNREEADGSLCSVCQRTEGKRLQNRELQDIEAAMKTKSIIKLCAHSTFHFQREKEMVTETELVFPACTSLFFLAKGLSRQTAQVVRASL